MAIFREYFSGSTDGTPIPVTSTDSAGANTVHVCSTRKGEIYLFSGNKSTAAQELWTEHGDTVSPIRTLIPPSQGLIPILPGTPLRNGKSVKVYTSTQSTAALFVLGWVNELSS